MSFFGKKKIGRPQSRRTLQRKQTRERSNVVSKKKSGSLRRKTYKTAAKLWGVAAFFLLLILFLILFFLFTYFKVQSVKIIRTDFRLNGEQISEYAQNLMGENIFLLSQKKIEQDFQKVFPEISKVTLKRMLPNTIYFQISSNPIAFRWACELSKKKITETGAIENVPIQKLFFINANGQMSNPNPDEQEAFLVYEKSPCPKKIRRHQQILSKKVVDTLQTGKKELETILGKNIDRAGYFRDGQEIHFVAEDNTAYWIDFASPLEEQISKLKMAIKLQPDLQEAREHIDLRIPKKIFYTP